jgi:uncharacterized membrane protein (UPF0127 family)
VQRRRRILAAIIIVGAAMAGAGLGPVRAASCDVPIFAYHHGMVIFTEGGREERVRVEIADTEDRVEVGLMCRPALDPDAGMLFVFGAPTRTPFWMKNTFIPLAIAFMDSDWHIVRIMEMPVAPDPTIGPFPTYGPEKPYRFALEVNASYFAKHDLDDHAQVRFVPQEGGGARPKSPDRQVALHNPNGLEVKNDQELATSALPCL